jgi:molybdopterin converting factor small subunit
MITVAIWGELRPAVGGRHTVDLDARSIGELMRKLEEQYPRTQPFIEDGIAVSINGTIYQDSWNKPLPDNAEIYLLPRIAGG